MSNPKATIKKLSRRLRIFKILLLAVLFSPHASADECRVELKTRLSLVYDSFMPTVTARINGHKVIMGIDTGAQQTVITPETAGILNLPELRGAGTKMIITTGTAYVKKVILKTLEFGAVKRRQMSAVVLSIPLKPLKNKAVAGLIGTDVLADYDIDLDPPHGRISLYKAEGCSVIVPPWHRDYSLIPVTVTDRGHIALPVRLDGHRLKAIFDTGAKDLRLSLSSALHAGIKKKDLIQDPVLGINGLGGSLGQARLHRFNKMQIGSELFRGRIRVVDFPLQEADMLLGENFIRGRRFWISYATHALLIQKPRRY